MAKSTNPSSVAAAPDSPAALAPDAPAPSPPVVTATAPDAPPATVDAPPLDQPVMRDNLGRAYDAPDLPPGFGDRVLHACLSPALGELRAFDEESIRTRARNAAALVIGADQLVREYLEGRMPDYLRR